MNTVRNIFYCYHPDFIQDGESYKVLDVGKYVVEWDELAKKYKPKCHLEYVHKKQTFTTKEQAQQFVKTLIRKLPEQKQGLALLESSGAE